MKTLPSQEYLRSRIEYDPETGEARWKEVDESFGSAWKQFNTSRAGHCVPKYPKIDGETYSRARILYKLYYGKEVVKIRFVDKDSSNLRACNLTDATCLDERVRLAENRSSTLRPHKKIPAEISNLLRYDHRTGDLIWKERDSPSFNTRYAGRPAGYYNSDEYRRITISSFGSYPAHRIAWYLYYGEDPVNYQIDHKDGNRTNNSILNLRLATASLNSHTRKVDRQIYTRYGKYSAVLSIKNNQIRLGDFDTPQEAQQAYDEAIKRYKPIYEFTAEEQAVLDELYRTYPQCDALLQKQAHCLQVRAVQWYETAFQRATNEV